MNGDKHLREGLAISGNLVDSIHGGRECNAIFDEGGGHDIASTHLVVQPIRFILNIPRSPFLAPQVFHRPIHLPEVEADSMCPSRRQEVNEENRSGERCYDRERNDAGAAGQRGHK